MSKTSTELGIAAVTSATDQYFLGGGSVQGKLSATPSAGGAFRRETAVTSATDAAEYLRLRVVIASWSVATAASLGRRRTR